MIASGIGRKKQERSQKPQAWSFYSTPVNTVAECLDYPLEMLTTVFFAMGIKYHQRCLAFLAGIMRSVAPRLASHVLLRSASFNNPGGACDVDTRQPISLFTKHESTVILLTETRMKNR
jgi:hypothetical protein